MTNKTKSMAEAWARQDRLSEQKRKMDDAERSRRYYNRNKEKVKDRVAQNYYKIRLHIFELMGNKCVFCGETRIDLLNPHHRVPMTVKSNKIYHYQKNLDILMPLCGKCHMTWHGVMDWLHLDDIYKE